MARALAAVRESRAGESADALVCSDALAGGP
jgi:hypothetical protein